MNSNGNNDWRRHSAIGVTERPPDNTWADNTWADNTRAGATQDDPFANAYVAFDDESSETEDAAPPSQRRRTSRRRKRVIGGLMFVFLVAVTGVCLWVVTGDHGKTKINLPVRDASAQQGDRGIARNPDDVTAEAIAEIRSADQTPATAASAPPLPVSGSIAPATPVTVPLETIGGTVLSPGKETTPKTNLSQAVNAATTAKLRATNITSERNPERSIRCAATAPSSILRPGAKPEI